METIWKYEILTEDKQIISMPIGAEILTVQIQHGMPVLWAKVNPLMKHVDKTIIIFGTGHPITQTEGLKYIGTYQLLNGNFIGHVFELI
jgi:hypothetical protein